MPPRRGEGMHTSSKGCRRFKSRIDYFQEDMESIEVFLMNKEYCAGNEAIFRLTTLKGQPKLSKRQNSEQSRTLVLRHLQHTIYVTFIKEIYEEVMSYFSYVLFNVANVGSIASERLIGNNSCDFTANDILTKTTKEEIISMVTNRIFRVLENKRDTLLLITELKKRLALEISDDIIKAAMPFLLARHIYVHTDGVPDATYSNNYANMKLDNKGRIKLNKLVIYKAKVAISRLILEFDKELKEKNLIPLSEFA